MISHKHKAIFVHVPKTAGSSMRRYFGKRGFGAVEYHAPDGSNDDVTGVYVNGTAWRIKRNLLGVWDDYFKFTFVRNPWDRMVSFFNYQKKVVHKKEKYGIEHFSYEKYKKSTEHGDFSLWLGEHRTMSFLNFLSDDSGNLMMDFIGKVENLQEDFNIVCDKIKIPRQQLPHINKTKHKHYTEYYDEETKSIVAEKCKKDIEYFNYKFGE